MKKHTRKLIVVKATNSMHFSLFFEGNKFVILQQSLFWQHYKVYFYFLDKALPVVHRTFKAFYFI